MSKGRLLLLGKDLVRLQRRGELLRQAGFTTSLTQTLEEARRLCREMRYLAAIVGHAVDARERTQAIRYLREECGVPIVLITEGKGLTGLKADAYVPQHEEDIRLRDVLAEMIGSSA
jgi:DNA-binding response OmpR family regulator